MNKRKLKVAVKTTPTVFDVEQPAGFGDDLGSDLFGSFYDQLLGPSTYFDDKACSTGDFDKNTEPRFIPLEDEARTEVGDSITYTSKEVNFREIAEAETYDETSLISDQEQILLAAQIEIDRLSNLSSKDSLIAAENDAQGRLKQCSNALSDNDLEKQFISETNTRISNIANCSLSDGNVFDTLWGTSLTDEDLNQLGILVDKDYSSEAAYAALKKFTDSEHKTSTNII